MIFEGFTDPNGNLIPIQGAGILYNEEKNSIALGKDTVATGQDQFVFGRKNIEDPNKVEVVGGGLLINSSYKFTYWETTTGYSHIIFKIGDTKADLEYYLSKRFNRPIAINGWSNDIKGVFLDHNSSFLALYFDVSNSEWTAGDTTLYLAYSNGSVPNVIQFEDATEYSIIASTSAGSAPGDTYMEMYKLYYAPEYIKNATLVPANLRTLDWQGNQWNAGDITCDDGKGNTISMRDLLSRIATLEAAAAES
jgi:hypothetical protein